MGREECEIRSAAPSLVKNLYRSATLLLYCYLKMILCWLYLWSPTYVHFDCNHNHYQETPSYSWTPSWVWTKCLRRALGAGHDRHLAGCPLDTTYLFQSFYRDTIIIIIVSSPCAIFQRGLNICHFQNLGQHQVAPVASVVLWNGVNHCC